MSIFDAERQQLGISTGGQASPSEAPTQSKSIFDDERAKLFAPAPTQTDQQPQPNFQQDMMQRQNFVDVNQSPLMQKIQQTQPMQGPPAPDQMNNDQSRQLPIIGPILRTLDAVANNPIVEKIGELGRDFYTPGASLENVGALAGAAENAVSRLAPNLGSSLLGRVAQKAASEAITGAPVAAGQALTQTGDLQDAAKQGLYGAALGGALGAAGPGIGAGLSKLADKYAGTKLGDALGKFFNNIPTQPATDILALPAAGETYGSRLPMLREGTAPSGDVIPMPGNVEPLALPSSTRYDEIQRIKNEQVLGLPEPHNIDAINRSRGTVQPYGSDPIYAPGDVYQPPVLGLPAGNYVAPSRLKVADNTTTLNYVMGKIRPEVEQAIIAPSRRDLLVNYIVKNLDVPVDEVHNMPNSSLQELGQHIEHGLRQRLPEIASSTAKKYGYDLPSLLEGHAKSISERAGQDAQARAYGVYPDNLPNVKTPNLNKQVISEAAAPRMVTKLTGVKPRQPEPIRPNASISPKEAADRLTAVNDPIRRMADLRKPIVTGRAASPVDTVGFRQSVSKPLRTSVAKPTEQPISGPLARPMVKAASNEIKPAQPPLQGMRERGVTQTIRTSDQTPEPLRQALPQPELYKTRSTVKLHEDAQKYIDKKGTQSAYDFVMGAKKMTDQHNAVAQILAKQLANSGDISRAIDVVSKTAKSGTELGRAIQSLSLWNRMDPEGAMLLAQRQLNRGANGGRDLTEAETVSIRGAAQKIQDVEHTKSLAQEVTDIVANKPAGEKLTDAEIAKIKEFQKQVTDINGKVKQFLPGEKAARPQKVIEEVNKIKPEDRTIDQLKDYWDARAERARQKLAKQRSVGLLPNTENPVLLYAELGVAKIAKGALQLADFTDQMVRENGEKVRPIINQVYNQAVNMFRKSQGLPTANELSQVVNRAVKTGELDAESAAHFKNWANQIAFYTDENLRTEAVQDLQLALRRLDKSTLGEKISSLQAGAQLLSIPTTVRNVIGNEAFNLLEKVNKVTAVPIDWAVSKMTKERSVVFNAANQEQYWANWLKGAQGGWKGVSANGKLSSYDIRPEVFSGRNPLQYIARATGAELQSFDHAAYMRASGDVLATFAEQLGKTQGLNGQALKEAIPSLIQQLDQSIYDMADEAGKYATFQDDTALSKAAEAVKKGLNYPTKLIGDAAVKAGILPERLNPSGFGLGDVVLKYAKTPANIVMRAIDYSPIGILRGIMQMAPLLTKREFNQRQAVLALSRGITGTLGLTGLGYYLASQGILTGAPSSDYDVKSLYDAAGQKGYQVNISALQRWVMGGLNKDAAKYQNGDKLINYDWLQPMAISLAMGVNANQTMNEKKAGVNKSAVSFAGSMIYGGLQTVMQQPLVQGVQQVFNAANNAARSGYKDWSGFANILKGVPASFVPALSGQVRNFTDNTARSTYDPSTLKSMVNMVMNKIPGLAEKLPAQINTLGGERQVIDNGQAGTVGQGLNVFVNPAKVTSYHVSPEAAMVVQLINDTGNTTVAPRVPKKYIMLDKQKIDLTPSQYTQLQQSTSQFTATQLQRMSPMLTSQTVPDQRKVDAIVKVLDDAGKRGRAQLERQYPELRPKPKAAR